MSEVSIGIDFSTKDDVSAIAFYREKEIQHLTGYAADYVIELRQENERLRALSKELSACLEEAIELSGYQLPTKNYNDILLEYHNYIYRCGK